jgi:hypothetical protein
MIYQTRVEDADDPNEVGRKSYMFCLDTALNCILQARSMMEGDPVDENHELPLIERLLKEALTVS